MSDNFQMDVRVTFCSVVFDEISPCCSNLGHLIASRHGVGSITLRFDEELGKWEPIDFTPQGSEWCAAHQYPGHWVAFGNNRECLTPPGLYRLVRKAALNRDAYQVFVVDSEDAAKPWTWRYNTPWGYGMVTGENYATVKEAADEAFRSVDSNINWERLEDLT